MTQMISPAPPHAFTLHARDGYPLSAYRYRLWAKPVAT